LRKAAMWKKAIRIRSKLLKVSSRKNTTATTYC